MSPYWCSTGYNSCEATHQLLNTLRFKHTKVPLLEYPEDVPNAACLFYHPIAAYKPLVQVCACCVHLRPWCIAQPGSCPQFVCKKLVACKHSLHWRPIAHKMPRSTADWLLAAQCVHASQSASIARAQTLCQTPHWLAMGCDRVPINRILHVAAIWCRQTNQKGMFAADMPYLLPTLQQ